MKLEWNVQEVQARVKAEASEARLLSALETL